MENEKKELTKQVGKFGIVGVINTFVDIGIFNFLKFIIGLSTVFANIISVSAAIVNSYIWNKKWTFRDKEKNVSKQFVVFVVLSLGGLIINTVVLMFLTQSFTYPSDLAVNIVHFLKLNSFFSDSFVFFNFAKITAILFSMVWDFITYKKFAFKEGS